MIALLKRLYGFRQGRVSARKYAREQQRLISRLSGMLARDIRKDINREVERTGRLVSGANEPTMTQVQTALLERLQPTLTKHFNRCFKTVYEGNRDKYDRLVKKQVDVGSGFDFSRNKDMEGEIFSHVLRRQNFITNVSDNLGKQIIQQVEALRREGLGNAAIGRELRNRFDFISRRRADVIARTETHAVVSAAQDSYHERLSNRYAIQVKKRWLATSDARTRSSHAIMNGKEVAMDEKFVMPNGTRMKHVGDPAGGPSNTINCRCVILYVDVEEEIIDSDVPILDEDEPPELEFADIVSDRNKTSAADYQRSYRENVGGLTNATAKRVPKPNRIIQRGAEGEYNSLTNTIVSDLSVDGGSTLVHEYGHHVDAMLLKAMTAKGKTKKTFDWAFSQKDKAFIEAFDADRKENGLVKSISKQRAIRADTAKRALALEKMKADLYEVEQKVVGGSTFTTMKLRDPSYGGVSDIIDAATKGLAFAEENFWGHGRGYYRRKDLPEMYETFANCFQAYDTPAWPKVQKYFPRTAARFEQILEEFNRTGDITFDEFGT